ncbi:hypothetical protein [Paraburkholderia caledonica]|uniref:Uncharacterized protein n=1 Tax=Paraburkholderia caledonica TaxID=134536 RepID=A0AB73IPY3_9BURK|nr:hypothetical protein [Paraburkholderia caledonica]
MSKQRKVIKYQAIAVIGGIEYVSDAFESHSQVWNSLRSKIRPDMCAEYRNDPRIDPVDFAHGHCRMERICEGVAKEIGG